MTDISGASSQTSHERLSVYYATLLDSLADGVLSISPDHRIEVLNATGASILGCAPRDVMGRTLVDVFLSDEANDAFVDAILAATRGDQAETMKTVVDFSRNGLTLRLAVASTAYRLKTGSQAGRVGVVVTFNDITEMARLRTAEEQLERALADEHVKLQAAYVQLEDSVERERRASKRVGLIRTAAIFLIFSVFAGVGTYNWWTSAPSLLGGDSSSESIETYTVAPRQISSRVSVVGNVDAGSVVSVVAPFDGPVRTKSFEYGGAVNRGDVLLTIDAADVQLRLREAESAVIKARQRLTELKNWSTGIDVSRARRQVSAAELESNNLKIKMAQTKQLLSKGIVPAEEMNQLVQQQYTQNSQLESARQDLVATIERGSEENVRIGEYDLLNAQAKMDELRGDLARASVTAPVSGVVLQPTETDGKQTQAIGIGSRVNRGQTIFSIGDLESFSIKAKVDEIDINKVRVGQNAVVTGDAFEGLVLNGVVTSVAAQAIVDQNNRTGTATFPITIQIPSLTPEQRRGVHVGMSATLTIVAYDNANALVVPPNAIRTDDGKRLVKVTRNGQVEDVEVTLGISTPDGIEIRDGLKEGDVIQIGG